MDRAAPVGAVLRIPLAQIRPGPNARGDVGDVTELATSLKTLGQQVPVIVEQVDAYTYELLDGHRRRAAAHLAGLSHLDAVIRATPDGPHRVLRQLAIQGGAKGFGPIAEAEALQELRFTHGLSREQIAAAVGRSPAWVRDRLLLVHLSDAEKRAVAAGRMTIGEALIRLRQPTAEHDSRPVPPAGPPPRLPRPDGNIGLRKAPAPVCPTCHQPLPAGSGR